MKKNFAQQATVTMLIICFLTSGCSRTIPSNNAPANDMQTLSEQPIIIETESSNFTNTESSQVSETTSPVEPSSSNQIWEQSLAQTESSSEKQDTPAPTETAPSVNLNENISTENNPSQLKSNSTQVLNGYTMLDGIDTPVQINFQVTDVIRGDDAYKILAANQPNFAPADPGMEYIIITFNVTYKSGEADMLMFEESNASLDAAKLYFYLSNGNSNAEQLTNLLSDNIYNLSLDKGNSGVGSVAFLHKADSNEPLYFIGFGNTLEFDLN